MPKKKEQIAPIYIGVIPGIFGYGIAAWHPTEDGCRKALKAKFYDWKRQQPSPSTFESAFERWGGRIELIEAGKAYYDDFGS